MSDTLRTDTLLIAHDMSPEPEVLINHARDLERELNAANARIKALVAERDTARLSADTKWNLRDEFQLALGTEDIAEGVEAVKCLKERIKRLEEAGDEMFKWSERVGQEFWTRAKEAKP